MIKRLLLAVIFLTANAQVQAFNCYQSPRHERERESQCPVPNYEQYPGIAYENSFTSTQVVVATVVGVAFVTLVVVLLVNTPGHHGHHHH